MRGRTVRAAVECSLRPSLGVRLRAHSTSVSETGNSCGVVFVTQVIPHPG